VLLGDRYETFAAALAATLGRVPVVHLYGGEETEGAIDNAIRHALTKLSHLHLVSHETHARRVLQMGEPEDTVVVVGAAGLDNLHRSDLPGRAELENRLGLALESPVVAVTLHPATLGDDPGTEVRALSAAMERVPATYIVTLPNADAGGDVIREHWARWARGRARVVVVDALGETFYWSLLRSADAVLGNSSSGIIEAPAAGLPVINVGDRQRGRLRSAHVEDVPAEANAIEAGLRAVLAPDARQRYQAMPPLYPAGPSAPRIVQALAAWRIPNPPRKRFHDLPMASG
jgi:UDP-hydrolysing UDP-N-acetyl-D-glucosamine 2-epimerase